MKNYRSTRPRTRTMTVFGYTYIDKICRRCLAIITEQHCIHCERRAIKEAEKFKQLKARRDP